MIHAMPVMSVALSPTIVRDAQRVCEHVSVSVCQYVESGMDARRERERYNDIEYFGYAAQMTVDFALWLINVFGLSEWLVSSLGFLWLWTGFIPIEYQEAKSGEIETE